MGWTVVCQAQLPFPLTGGSKNNIIKKLHVSSAAAARRPDAVCSRQQSHHSQRWRHVFQRSSATTACPRQQFTRSGGTKRLECQEAALPESAECEGEGLTDWCPLVLQRHLTRFMLSFFYSDALVGPQNHPCVQRHPGVPGGGRGGGVHGGPDHLHQEPGPRSAQESRRSSALFILHIDVSVQTNHLSCALVLIARKCFDTVTIVFFIT